MPEMQHLQNAAAVLAGAVLGRHTTTGNVTPELGAGIYFACFDALVAEENRRRETYAENKKRRKAAEEAQDGG